MSLVCEISGEPLLGDSANEIVVTPSGHICIKRLLLTKLVENGGLDPFETVRELPLSEDQLVTLRTGSGGIASAAAPPRPQTTSLPSMLGMIQKEYDALVLELFDTRKALEETRRELSQALYQNDAAVRVVARVVQERDTAKQQLEQWNASANAPAATSGGATGDSAATAETAEAAAEAPSAVKDEQPSAKRRRILEPTAEVLENDLPDEDLGAMSDVWTELNKLRKPTLKAAAAEAPSPQTLGECEFLETKAWHKSTNRGIPCISSDGDGHLTVTAGKDKQVVVYNEIEKVVQHTFALGSVATCVDIKKGLVAAGNAKGTVAAFSLGGEGAGQSNTIEVGSPIVDVRVHPTGQHVCAATKDGRVVVACWIAGEERLQQIASFAAKEQKESYTSAALHPDGLIYIAGTKTGKLHVWDFKNKVLATTLQEGDEKDAITAVAVSNNGYHIAAGHDSTAVRYWDLRKQKVVATLEKQLGSIRTVAFDRAGKYAAMGGKGGVKITTIKEWGTTATCETKKPVSGIVWTNSSKTDNATMLEASCDGERAVQVFGVPSSDSKSEEK
mmetsp:Transcript_26603/g.62495  ORF Transcript_26603/g.62495 Transcript_26603/m.62495 type:complete len:560 (+) Transcript_26603:221-1900(+)